MNALPLVLGLAGVTALAVLATREAKASEQPNGPLPTPRQRTPRAGKQAICFTNEKSETECYQRPLRQADCMRLLYVAANTKNAAFAAEIAVALAEDGITCVEPSTTKPPITSLPFGVPPINYPIPGGNYIEGIGWCPPGYVYNLATKVCEPEHGGWTTQGDNDACCASCAVGGECIGCK